MVHRRALLSESILYRQCAEFVPKLPLNRCCPTESNQIRSPKTYQRVFQYSILQDVYLFPIILVFSMAGCIVATLLTPPENMDVLKSFYSKVRPWGFWKPVHEAVVADNPDFVNDSNFKMDMFNVFIGTIWQTSMVILALYLIVQNYLYTALAVLTLAITSYVLKKTWYDKLEKDKK